MDKDGYHGYYRDEPFKQRHWFGLTDEEIWEALSGIDCTRPMLIARAIEAKLKEKNT